MRAKTFENDERGSPSRIVGINVDITEFKHIQSQLRNAKIEVNTANKIKSEFLSRMSHEIRTPMNAIIGMGHLLKDTSLSRQQLNYISHIDESADSLLHIIDDILDFSRLESGSYILENTHFDLDKLLEAVTQKHTKRAELKNIEIIFNIDKSTPRFVKGDQKRLQQVIENLIDNAIKFTHENGNICVDIKKTEDDGKFVELYFSIHDDGIGISEAQLSDLFDPFMQADGSSSRKHGGTGIGLTICKHIIEQMGSTLTIESQIGKGCCVSFPIKFSRSQMGESPCDLEPQRYHDLQTLIVDDHPLALKSLENTARSLQLKTISCSSGHEAIDLLKNADKQHKIDLVLIDFKMPTMNGLDTAKAIASLKLSPKPKLILISNFTHEEIIGKYPLTHVDGFINKPVTHSRLLDSIAYTFGETLFDKNNGRLPDNDIELSVANDPLKDCTVLLAEDNIVNQRVAIGILKRRHVNVVVANNGEEAVNIFNHEPEGHFAAILMDMEMPKMDGYAATRYIRQGQHSPDIPIIAMTAHALSSDRQRCLDTGMDDYITKPVNPEKLYQALAQQINQHHQDTDR